MAKTKIEWATHTWNPVTGCSPVSEGCRNCYAERMSKRLAGRYGYPKDEPFRVTLHKDRLEEPLRWRKPRMVFVCSMGDLFHEDVPDEWLLNVFDVIRKCSPGVGDHPEHTFLLLTKRPERMHDVLNRVRFDRGREQMLYMADCAEDKSGLPLFGSLSNIWLGVTAENQETADERIPILLQIPAAKWFVSVEPMMGPVDLGKWLACPTCAGSGVIYNPLIDDYENCPAHFSQIHWVICGGETGPGARPMHPDWVRDLRDQCVDANVPFFFKSWGEWLPVCGTVGEKHELIIAPNGETVEPFEDMWHWENDIGYQTVARIGKKRAGRDLDGREWNEMPGDSDA